MRAVDIITRKRDKQELTKEEIEFFIRGFTAGEIPDYQAAAWAMAVLLNGMTPGETTDLTLAMAASGEMLDLTGVVDIAVDKHSTGGVGDKVTLVVEPLVAACGVPMGKMSGRGLGYSGGTLDKLESIPGYNVNLTNNQFLRQLKEVGVVLAGQSAELAPADGKLYALRDVTGTVPSVPLIASSVLSKKLAAGAQAIVLDVKAGNGAFMPTIVMARELAQLMVDIGTSAGRQVLALISDMNQPLGVAVGNALEVKEAIATLKGGGPRDLREHCLTLAEHLLVLGKAAVTHGEGRAMAEQALADGSGLAKFRALVGAQGGDTAVVDDPERLPRASLIETLNAPRSGYLSGVHARTVGETAVLLGAGREKKGDRIDHAVGVEVFHKVGDQVEKDEPLFSVHANDPAKLAEAVDRLLAAHTWSDRPVAPLPLFYDTIHSE